MITIWGGEPECSHQWTASSYYWDQRHASVLAAEGKDDLGSKKDARGYQKIDHCSLCGAVKCALGLEPTWQLFIEHLCECAKEWWRVLKKTGNLMVDIGDTFAGGKGASGQGSPEYQAQRQDSSLNKPADHIGGPGKTRPQDHRDNIPKMKLGIPHRLRFALNDIGWVSRDDIIWYKGKEYEDGTITKVAMPESVKDRMSCSYEMIFHFVKSAGAIRGRRAQKSNDAQILVVPPLPSGRTFNRCERYFWDLDAIRQPHQPSSIERYKGADSPLDLQPRGWKPEATPIRGGGTHWYLAGGGASPGDVWIIQPEPFALPHFAVWPSELCERVIKVACPPEVCPKCGKPRERITVVGYESHGQSAKAQVKTIEGERSSGDLEKGMIRPQELPYGRASRIAQTIGWSSCGCNEEFVPGVILDPFCGGSGRAARMARKLGRKFIGVDLKEDYLKMSVDCYLYGEGRVEEELKAREEGYSQALLIGAGE